MVAWPPSRTTKLGASPRGGSLARVSRRAHGRRLVSPCSHRRRSTSSETGSRSLTRWWATARSTCSSRPASFPTSICSGRTRAISRFLARLASFTRLIIYDKPGTGLSDPIPHLPTLEERGRRHRGGSGCRGLRAGRAPGHLRGRPLLGAAGRDAAGADHLADLVRHVRGHPVGCARGLFARGGRAS